MLLNSCSIFQSCLSISDTSCRGKFPGRGHWVRVQFLSTVTGKRNFGVTMSDPSFKFPIHPVRAGGYSLGKSALDMLSNLNNYFKFPSHVCHVVLISSSETLAGPGGDRASDAETAQCHSA